MKAKSSMALACLALSGAAGAQAVDPAALVAQQQSAVRNAVDPAARCRSQQQAGEIVVCGRRDDQRYRLDPRISGTVTDGRVPLDQTSALGAGDARCSPVGRAQQCTKGLDMLEASRTIGRGLRNLSERGD